VFIIVVYFNIESLRELLDTGTQKGQR